MPTYKAPLRDINFCFKEMFETDRLRALPGYEEVTDDLIDAILTEAAKLCENELFPANQKGDEEGCTWTNGEVRTPSGYKELYKAFVESGWGSLAGDPAYGGQGLPDALALLTEEMVCAANISFSLYPGLTRGSYILAYSWQRGAKATLPA